MIIFAIVCFAAIVLGFALLIIWVAAADHPPTNQRTTYYEFRYGDRRRRCRRRTHVNH